MNEVSKSPLDPRRKKQGFYLLRERGKMTVVLVDDPPSTSGGKGATPEQRAEVERLREERRKEAEARSLALRAKAEKNHRRTA